MGFRTPIERSHNQGAVSLRSQRREVQVHMNPFVVHLIGDFILQNEWMVENKKIKSIVCFVHVLVYLIPFLLTGLQWWQILLIGVQHFAQDRSQFVFWWMRVWKKVDPEKWDQLPLYVDQAFHLMWIEVVVLLARIQGISG